jgi:hypothetical protein
MRKTLFALLSVCMLAAQTSNPPNVLFFPAGAPNINRILGCELAVCGTEPTILDILIVTLRNPSAEGFLYFIEGTDQNGQPKTVSGIVRRHDVNGSTQLIFAGGMLSGNVTISEYIRIGKQTVILDEY